MKKYKFFLILVTLTSILSINAQDTLLKENFDFTVNYLKLTGTSSVNTNSYWLTSATGISGTSNYRTSWVIGIPQGGRGYSTLLNNWIGNPDPTSDHTATNINNKVAGQGLGASSKTQGVSGYYNSSIEWIRTPAINCSKYYNVKLSFWRWSNFINFFDSAFVEISNDSTTWKALIRFSPRDLNWVSMSYDISSYANFKSKVYIRWRSKSNTMNMFHSGWNIDDVVITGTKLVNSTWNGTTSSNWATAANWTPAYLPDTFVNVTISATANYKPIITGQAKCKNLIVSPNASLVINNGAKLKIYKDLTLQSNSTGTGVIIDNDSCIVYGTTKVQSYVAVQGFHFLSSPVKNASSVVIPSTKIYNWNEPNAQNNWSLGWVKITGLLLPMIGYDANILTAGNTITYIGKINTGAFTTNLTYSNGSESDDHKGWNLVGNPYPSCINWDLVSIANEIQNAIYIWNPLTRVYGAYVDGIGVNGATQYIAPGQSFFVKVATPGSYPLTFNNSVRVLNSNNKLKSSVQSSFIKLNVSGNNLNDETIIRFNTNASTQFDPSLDAIKKISSDISVPQFYSILDNKLYAINTLNELTSSLSLDLGFSVGVSGNYNISLATIEGIDETISIQLEDKLTGSLIDLRLQQNYMFSSISGSFQNRFVIHFGKNITKPQVTTNNSTNVNDNKLNIYSYKNTLYIKNITNTVNIELVDITGKIILIETISNDYSNELNIPDGNYIIRVISDTQTESQKVFIKK